MGMVMNREKTSENRQAPQQLDADNHAPKRRLLQKTD